MIDLTLAEIADIVGGELSDITPEAAGATRVTGTVEFDSRAVTPGGLYTTSTCPLAFVCIHARSSESAQFVAPNSHTCPGHPAVNVFASSAIGLSTASPRTPTHTSFSGDPSSGSVTVTVACVHPRFAHSSLPSLYPNESAAYG